MPPKCSQVKGPSSYLHILPAAKRSKTLLQEQKCSNRPSYHAPRTVSSTIFMCPPSPSLRALSKLLLHSPERKLGVCIAHGPQTFSQGRFYLKTALGGGSGSATYDGRSEVHRPPGCAFAQMKPPKPDELLWFMCR
eukprot:592423-Amphidinium_carterae.1